MPMAEFDPTADEPVEATYTVGAKLTAEFIGTAFLLMGVVGSGIMAERLSDDVGLQLLANSLATVGVLAALILALGPISGAHFNPVVTLAARLLGLIDDRMAAAYVVVQMVGAVLGVVVANLMFDLAPVSWSSTDRSGAHLVGAEVVATFGLVALIFTTVAGTNARAVSATVAAYIGGAYWFTSSTSFANPAVTVARTMSDTFAGIAPGSAPAFVAAQVVGAVLAAVAVRAMTRIEPAEVRKSG